MTRRFSSALSALFLCGIALAQAGLGGSLRAGLTRMGRRDHDVRHRASVLLRGLPKTAEQFKAIVAEQNEVDDVNFRRLEEIVMEHGWPGRQLVGEEASLAALIVLQHANVQQQRRYLSVLRTAVTSGLEPGTS